MSGRPDPSPTLHVVVRRTLDWADEAAVERALRPEFRAKYDAWNSVFEMRYAEFRRRLHDIARRNWERVADVAVVPFDRVPPRALLAPVDDDDWFAPDLASRVREAADPDARGYRWTCHVLEPRRLRRRWLGLFGPLGPTRNAVAPPTFTCETNGYAVADVEGWRDLWRSHGEASRRFDGEPARVRRIPHALAIQNKSLASQTVLDHRAPTVAPDFLRRRHRRYRDFYDPAALPDSLAWARREVAEMADLMRDLSLARRR
jgi:hypothetical protein